MCSRGLSDVTWVVMVSWLTRGKCARPIFLCHRFTVVLGTVRGIRCLALLELVSLGTVPRGPIHGAWKTRPNQGLGQKCTRNTAWRRSLLRWRRLGRSGAWKACSLRLTRGVRAKKKSRSKAGLKLKRSVRQLIREKPSARRRESDAKG